MESIIHLYLLPQFWWRTKTRHSDPERLLQSKAAEWENYKIHWDTFRKTSDTGPSFSDAASSCFTFSSPFIIACISSAKDFNCICKEVKPNWTFQTLSTTIDNSSKKEITLTFDAASKLVTSSWKSKSAGDLEARTWGAIQVTTEYTMIISS